LQFLGAARFVDFWKQLTSFENPLYDTQEDLQSILAGMMQDDLKSQHRHTEATPMEWLLIWILFSIPSAVIGSRRGSWLIGFFLGLVLGPVGPIFAANIPRHRQFCAFCLDEMPPTSLVCPHCRRGVSLQVAQEEFEMISTLRDRMRASTTQTPAIAQRRLTIKLRQLRSAIAQSKATQNSPG
jgi:hypothetical protein